MRPAGGGRESVHSDTIHASMRKSAAGSSEGSSVDGVVLRLFGVRARWLALVAVLHVLPFATRPAMIGGDEPHYALMAHSIAMDGDVAIRDDYDEVASGSKASGRKRAGQRLDPHLRREGEVEMFAHPLGLPLLAAPVIALQQSIAPRSSPDLVLGLLSLSVTFAGLLAGWALIFHRAGGTRDAVLLVLGAYFSSPLWYYSRSFLTEPYLWSFGVLAVSSLYWGYTWLASALLGLLLGVKETGVWIVVPVLVVAFRRLALRRAAILIVGPAVFVGVSIARNLLAYNTPFVTFQRYQIGTPLAGAVGLVVDPQRGLLWFAPLLLGGMTLWMLTGARCLDREVTIASVVVFLGFFAMTASWVDWRGGASFGPRLLLPALPALVIPTWDFLRAGARRQRHVRWLFTLLFAAGFAINWAAALDPVEAFWSVSAIKLITGKPLQVFSGFLLAVLSSLLLQRHAMARTHGSFEKLHGSFTR